VQPTYGTDDDLVGTLPSEWRLGVVVGGTGSGKTNILRDICDTFDIQTPDNIPLEAPHDQALVSHCLLKARAPTSDARTPSSEPIDRLGGVGLNTVHTWLQPMQTLSGGERNRATLALLLGGAADDVGYPIGSEDFKHEYPFGRKGLVLDDFGCSLDNLAGQAASHSLRKVIQKLGLSYVLVGTSNWNLLSYLRPDWVVFADYMTPIKTKGFLWTRDGDKDLKAGCGEQDLDVKISVQCGKF
jgi:hypothetical protein